MAKKLKKWTLMAGMIGIMGFSVYGCGKAQEALGGEQQSDIGDMEEENDASKEVPVTDIQSKNTSENTGKEDESGPDTELSGDGTAPSWDSTKPDLEGDIKEVSDMRITVIEAELSESDSGGDIMVLPSTGGDDSAFEKVEVTYDDKTLFSVQTIYNGGASYDVKVASAADLAEGELVDIWGDRQDDGLHAAHIRIVKVAK